MRTWQLNLAAALAILAALMVPLGASATTVLPNVTGSLLGPSTLSSILLVNDTARDDMLDIVKIEIDLSTAVMADSFWLWHGSAKNPDGGGLDGFSVGYTGGVGEAFDRLITLTITPSASGTPGFNGTERLELVGVDVRQQDLESGLPAVEVANLAGASVKVWFEYASGSEGTVPLDPPFEGFLEIDPANSNRLELVPIPEPSTAATLLLGLTGLAIASGRRI